MGKFGFIAHYLGVKHFCRLIGPSGRCFENLPSPIVKKMIAWLPPYQHVKISRVLGTSGAEVSGSGIIAPFIPEHLVTLGESAVLKKVIRAGQLAERLGASIIGLAGFTSVAGNEGKEVASKLNIAVTSGNTLTAALALQGMRKAATLMGISMERATVAIVGASGDIGSACFKVLVNEVAQLNIAARNEKRLNDLVLNVNSKRCKVVINKYVKEAVKDADIILSAASTVTTLIEPEDVKVGAIICDVAIPHSVAIEILRVRKDVLAFDGGLAFLPVGIEKNEKWLDIAPDGRTIFGCLAETVVLAMEKRFECFSIGRNQITSERIREMESLAQKHGIGLAPFTYQGLKITEAQLDSIRTNAKQNVSNN